MPSHTTILRGSAHPQTAFHEHDIIAIRAAYVAGRTVVSLSLRYGMSESQIRRILRGENWTHITGGHSLLRPGWNMRNVKLVPDQVREIIARHEADPGLNKSALGREFGVTRQQIDRILRGRDWPAITHGINRIRKAS
jgi:Mor family transcriptional regulator